MKNTKFGIIGVGGRGGVFCDNNHLPEEGYEIVAGCDINKEALDTFSKRFPDAKVYSDYHDLLEQSDIDAVFVITPDFLHAEMACAALEAGKHVYLEKPLAITADDCEKILRTAMETKRKLYLGHNMRFFPVIRKMKEIIDSGVLGKIQLGWCRHFINYGGDAYFHDWHSERCYTNGLLLQKGAHDIDILHWLMGSHTTHVVGMGMLSVYNECQRRPEGIPFKPVWDIKNYPADTVPDYSPVIDVEDSNMIMMQLASGKQAAYLQCHYAPDSERNYTIIGTCGRIENRGNYDNAQVLLWTKRAANNSIPDMIYTVRGVPGTHSGADPAIMKDFREYIRFDKRPATNPVEAMQACLVGIAAHDSMRGDISCKKIAEVPEDLQSYFGNKL